MVIAVLLLCAGCDWPREGGPFEGRWSARQGVDCSEGFELRQEGRLVMGDDIAGCNGHTSSTPVIGAADGVEAVLRWRWSGDRYAAHAILSAPDRILAGTVTVNGGAPETFGPYHP